MELLKTENKILIEKVEILTNLIHAQTTEYLQKQLNLQLEFNKKEQTYRDEIERLECQIKNQKIKMNTIQHRKQNMQNKAHKIIIDESIQKKQKKEIGEQKKEISQMQQEIRDQNIKIDTLNAEIFRLNAAMETLRKEILQNARISSLNIKTKYEAVRRFSSTLKSTSSPISKSDEKSTSNHSMEQSLKIYSYNHQYDISQSELKGHIIKRNKKRTIKHNYNNKHNNVNNDEEYDYLIYETPTLTTTPFNNIHSLSWSESPPYDNNSCDLSLVQSTTEEVNIQ